MRYTVILTDEVKAKLHALPLALRREIGHKLFLLEEDLAGSVKKLKGSRNEYRLRVGDWRALFEPRRPDGDGRCCRQSKGYLPMNPALPKSQPAAVDIDKQIRRGKAVLRELKTTLEDLEDRRELAAARKRNAGRPGTSLRQAAKELGL